MFAYRPAETQLCRRAASGVVCDRASFRYPGSGAGVVDLSFELAAGECVWLAGSNGAGKSTLLQMIAGQRRPSSGALALGKHDRVVYLPQRRQIDWRFPIVVERFARTGTYGKYGWLRRPPRHSPEIQEALERMGLADLRKRRIDELSGGQQQRLLVARGLAQGGTIWLLDEPFNGLDKASRETLLQVLSELMSAKATLMLADHREGWALPVYTRKIVLEEGFLSADERLRDA